MKKVNSILFARHRKKAVNVKALINRYIFIGKRDDEENSFSERIMRYVKALSEGTHVANESTKRRNA